MSSTAVETSPADGTPTNSSFSLQELQDRLDVLWIIYLSHLDAYTSSQKAVQQHMRSGFFSLSRANFKARPGMRYGQDNFHQRAVATRRVQVGRDRDGSAGGAVRWEVRRHVPGVADANDGNAMNGHGPAAVGLQQPSPPATPDSEDAKSKVTPDDSDPSSAERSRKEDGGAAKTIKPKPPLESDPLRWFGILIPQELRSAEASFSSVIDDSLADAVNAGRAMRETEAEIRKLRKEIRKAEKATKG